MSDSTALQTVRQPSVTLSELAKSANDHHGRCTAAANEALDHAHAAGDALRQAKRQCQHGEFAAWLRDNFQGSPQTARLYMLVAKRWTEIEAKRQRVGTLSLRQAAALTVEKPKDKIKLVNRAVKHLREALDKATTIEELKTIRDVALEAQNIAGEEVLRMERRLGQELTKLQEQRDTPQEIFATLPVDADLLAEIPELSADTMLRGVTPGEMGVMVEVHPSIAHPGYFHLVVYRDIDTDNGEVTYDKRGGRYDRRLLAYVLERCHGIRPTEWSTEPATGKEPWCVEADKTNKPGHVHLVRQTA